MSRANIILYLGLWPPVYGNESMQTPVGGNLCWNVIELRSGGY